MSKRYRRKILKVLDLLLRYRPTRRLTLWTTLIYASVYLWVVGDFSFHGWRSEFSVIWTQMPMEMLFKQRNLFYFEGIAIVNLPVATYLFSPVNLLLGLFMGLLVGFNLAFTFLSVKRSKASQGRSTMTFLVSIPALLAGTTCSAPLILVLMGVQASAAVLAFFSFLVPIALLMLIAALAFNVSHSDEDSLQTLAVERSSK